MKQQITSTALLERLKASYPDQCMQVSPFAFFKMQAIIEGGEAFTIPEKGCDYAIYNRHLLYYSAPDNCCHLSPDQLNGLDAISLPASIYDPIKDGLVGFMERRDWILRYDLNYVPKVTEFPAYEAVDFDFENAEHVFRAAQIINGDESDEEPWMTPKRIRHMMEYTAFDPSLWFFVKERESGRLVAISISAYSPQVRETDLDWIFVMPSNQGKGAGRFLIQETIRRCKGKSDVIRVGGEVDFYRKCGFVDDALWVWAAKPGYSFKCASIQP